MKPTVESHFAVSLADLYGQLRAQGLLSGQRYLVFISGSEAWCKAQLLELPRALDHALLVAENALCGLSPSCVENSLGREFSSLIINAHDHQKLNAWLAAAGCLTAGGVMLLLCPSFRDWPAQFSATSQVGENLSSPFMSRLLDLAQGLNGVLCWDQQAGFSGSMPTPADEWQRSLPTVSQIAGLAAIKKVVTGRAKRPLLIRSDRGRGKTSLLGLAVADLFRARGGQNPTYRVLITAPSFHAVKGAFEQLVAAIPEVKWLGDCCHYDSAYLQYLPIDVALHSPEQWDLVLVDEAAALPVSGLRTILLRHPRIVFSTTVHGYEGSGRGFDIRFKAILDTERPQWRRQVLHEPIRWAEDDPLEQALNTLFLLDAEPRDSDENVLDLCERLVTRNELGDEDLLAQLFGLLVQAHYQTTPQDLQYLLDGDGVLIVASRGECVLGVCQLLPEGGFDGDLTADIIAGRRRPNGHLVAQRLAHNNAEPTYLAERSLRINRIAVVAGSRRQGLGKAMLNVAGRYARAAGLSYLSSSFAAESGVIDFWLSQGFSPVYLGSRRDSASGLYSLIVLKGLRPEMAERTLSMTRQLHSDLALSLASVYAAISPELLLTLLAASRDSSVVLAQLDIARVQRYCAGELIFEQAAASMACLCLNYDLRNLSGADLAIARLLLGHSWSMLSEQFEIKGRGEIEQRLKIIFQQLISH